MTQAEKAPQIEERGFDLLPEAEPMTVQDIRDVLVIREGDTFLLTDINGQVQRGNPNGYGLYYRDTRYLSGYEFAFSNARPLTLLSTAQVGFSAEHVMANPSMLDAEGQRLTRATIQVRRLQVLGDVLEETIRVLNYNTFPVTLEINLRFAADFADIFEIRGYEPEARGALEAPIVEEGSLAMRYMGTDGHRRETMITFDPHPELIAADADVGFVTFRLSLASQESTSVSLVVSMDGRLEAPRGEERFAAVAQDYQRWRSECTEVQSDSQFFDAVLRRSLDDLRMLWHPDGGGGYPAAGTPWYDTLFGRDTCITGLQTLAFNPEIARQGLAELARHQGAKFDSWRDEEPGKILHELRHGELTESGELPFSPYYGSIDSTLLFLFLAGEYFRWTDDVEVLRELKPNLEAALHWMDEFGYSNDDGYIAYEKRSVKGLINQGWKDSADAMVHADGSLMSPPITLVEVQGYAYAGLVRLAAIFRSLGEECQATELEGRAEDLRRRFNEDFWVGREGCFALGIDGNRRQASSVTSNAGHALWSGIAEPEKAAATTRRLLQQDIYSGWGVRTLSSRSPRYNPQGYHLGTIWPHDNSVVGMGFKRYGGEAELNTLASSLFQAALHFQYYRLPELFGGSDLSTHQIPVPYPVACRPQAWAAGAFPLITQAILGLCPDAPNNVLYVVNPKLPEFVSEVNLRRLRVGRSSVDLRYRRSGAHTRIKVLSVDGNLRVEQVKAWPEHLL
jgi:glycogen debranching enzyme